MLRPDDVCTWGNCAQVRLWLEQCECRPEGQWTIASRHGMEQLGQVRVRLDTPEEANQKTNSSTGSGKRVNCPFFLQVYLRLKSLNHCMLRLCSMMKLQTLFLFCKLKTLNTKIFNILFFECTHALCLPISLPLSRSLSNLSRRPTSPEVIVCSPPSLPPPRFLNPCHLARCWLEKIKQHM